MANPLIIAHRGASHAAPENTLAAFRLAWQEGADGIEGDFRLTRDGHVVCIHDATTKRTADRDLCVAEATLDELRALDLGRWKGEQFAGERIATLAEVLAIIPAGNLIYVEVKSGPETVPAIERALVASAVLPEQLQIIAFDPAVIAAAKRQLPQVTANLLVDFRRDETGVWSPSVDEILAHLKATSAEGLGTAAKPAAVDAALVRALRAGSYDFHVWTIDDLPTAQHFIALGVDSITTNRPRELRAELSG